MIETLRPTEPNKAVSGYPFAVEHLNTGKEVALIFLEDPLKGA